MVLRILIKRIYVGALTLGTTTISILNDMINEKVNKIMIKALICMGRGTVYVVAGLAYVMWLWQNTHKEEK